MHGRSAPHQSPTVHPSGAETRRPWTVMVLALVAQVLVVLDISVVNTALPTIGGSLDLESTDLQWMVTAYLLMSGGGLLLGGRIADLVPRRRVFLAGMSVFTAASLLSGFASAAGQLIACRGAQGVGAALMTPAALSLIMTTYHGAQRARGLALWGAVGGLGIAAGVLAGGALTTWAGWQAIFWVNVPVGVVSLVVGAHVLPRQARSASVSHFDVGGAATLVGGLALLMLGIAGSETYGWASPRTVLELAGAAFLLAGFVVVEQRSARPLVPPHTWSVKPLVSGTVVVLGVTGILVGAVFLGSIFLQTVLGYSALEAGLAFLPLAAALVVGTHLAAHVGGHVPARLVAGTGLAVAAGGAAWISQAGSGASYAADLLPGLVVLGLGAGTVFVAATGAAMSGIPEQHAGLASGFMMTGHEVGAALGVAVISAVATSAGELTSATGAVDAAGRGFLGASAVALLFAVFALVRMPATRGTGGHGHLH